MASWTMKASYTYGRCVRAKSFQEALDLVIKTFTENGWGLPPGTTNIDFRDVFAKKKVDENFRPSQILGFCHPTTAHTVLLKEPAAGVLLPCNVVVAEKVPGEIYEVATIAPAIMGQLMDNSEELKDTIMGVDSKILGALDALPTDEELRGMAWP